MRTFNVEIIVKVKARDKNEALKLVRKQYRLLDENDYKGHELRVISE